MAGYFLAITDSKEEYLGTINVLFSITTAYQFVVRIASGILTLELLPMVAVGIAAILAGRFLGSRIVDKLDGARMKKIIYAFLAVAGVITILQAI